MNIYKALNDMILYIEDHLDDIIEYRVLANILGVNEYTMKNLFQLLCNISLSDYIRKRKLSNAGYDLYNGSERIMDIAIKYGYNNATSFSRAFEKFHGIKPSQVKKNPKQLKNFPKLSFDENYMEPKEIEYRIMELDDMVLYGTGVRTNCNNLGQVAPAFFNEMQKKYQQLGEINYGMTVYTDRFEHDDCEYWVLWKQNEAGLQEFRLPKSKWLVFQIDSDEAIDIQTVIHEFYFQFLPSCRYNLRDIPELEYYHDNRTEFLVPIEN